MKTTSIFLPLVALLTPAAGLGSHPGCTCGPTTAAVALTVPAAGDAVERHPLKGVVVNVVTDRSALLVKHEEIPGVMKAMTMMLKVDAAALTTVKKDEAVTGLLVRKADGWWLEEVKVAAVP